MASTAGSVKVDNSMGCLFLASIFSMALWGVGSIQVYYYYDTYWKDSWWLKLHVLAVWFIDTAHQALILHATYTYLVTEYAKNEYLNYLLSTLRDTIILTAFACAIVQAFFIMRIWRLSKHNRTLTGIVVMLVTAQFGCTVAYYAKCYHFTTFTALKTIFGMTHAINAVTVAADCAIAAILVFDLQTSRKGVSRSDSIINHLMTLTINTGLLTSIFAVITLITGLVLHDTLIYMVFYLVITRLYMNSMLAILNSRRAISGKLTDSSKPQMNSISLGRIRPGTNQEAGRHRAVNIMVDTVTVNDNGGFKHDLEHALESDLDSTHTNKAQAI